MRAILVLTVALAAAPSAWARGSTDVPKEEWRMTCLDNCLLQSMTWLDHCPGDARGDVCREQRLRYSNRAIRYNVRLRPYSGGDLSVRAAISRPLRHGLAQCGTLRRQSVGLPL